MNDFMANMIDAEVAAHIALQRVPGVLLSIELDTDDNRFIYEINIRNDYGDYEIKVDALTGVILSIESD